MTGVIDTKGKFHQLYFYKIEELCQVLTRKAIDENLELRKKYNAEYHGKITRFSKDVLFCLHELGWMIYDPFSLGREEVLFSNGKRDYIASLDYVQQPGFNRFEVDNEHVGFPLLTDSFIGYKKLDSLDGIEEGIIDEEGYVSSAILPSLNDLATIILMFDMMRDEEVYRDYLENKDIFKTPLEYITSKKNCISIKKLEDETYTISYVTENDGVVKDFIDALIASGKIAGTTPAVLEDYEVRKVA